MVIQSFLLLAFISGRCTPAETDGWATFPRLMIDGIKVRGCASAAMSAGPWLPPPLVVAPLLLVPPVGRRRNFDPGERPVALMCGRK